MIVGRIKEVRVGEDDVGSEVEDEVADVKMHHHISIQWSVCTVARSSVENVTVSCPVCMIQDTTLSMRSVKG